MFNVKRKVFVIGFLFVFVSLIFSAGTVEGYTNQNSKQQKQGITFSVDSRLLDKRLTEIKINGNDFSGDEIEKALGKSHEIKFNSEVEICFDEMEGYDLYCVIYENEKEAKNFGAIEQKKLCFEFTEEDDGNENSVKAKGDEDIVVKLYYQKIKPIRVTVPKMDNCDVSVKIVRDGKECGIFGVNEEIELERGDEIKKTIVYNSGYDAPKEDHKEITVDSKFTEKSFLDFIKKGKPERESQLFFDIPNEFNCTVELNGETSFDCYNNKEPLKVKSGDVVKFYLTKPELKKDERVLFSVHIKGWGIPRGLPRRSPRISIIRGGLG